MADGVDHYASYGTASCGAPLALKHLVLDVGVTSMVTCSLHGPLCPRVVALDGSAASTSEMRRFEVLVPPRGACYACLPCRVPAVFEVWRTREEQDITEDDENGLLSFREDLCLECTMMAKEDWGELPMVRALP